MSFKLEETDHAYVMWIVKNIDLHKQAMRELVLKEADPGPVLGAEDIETFEEHKYAVDTLRRILDEMGEMPDHHPARTAMSFKVAGV